METMKIKTVDENMQMSIIASVAFEANRQYCEMIGGKPFNPSWTEVSQDDRDSMIKAVKEALTDRIVSAELSHLRWMLARTEQGWEFGPQYSIHRKTDPNLVPFKELSFQEQLKDILFLAIANSLGAAMGYREVDDMDLDAEAIQEHEETVADLETATTGKTDFVPAGEGDGVPIGESPEKPENGLPETPVPELGADAEGEGEKLGVVDTIDEHTSPGKGPEMLDKMLADDEQAETKPVVAPEAVEKPNLPAGEVSDSSEPTTAVPIPAGEEQPPDDDPVDHKATKAKKEKKK